MDIERSRQVQRVLSTVLAAEPGQWPELLASSCEGDAELRREVEELLSRLDEADRFLESPPTALAAALLADTGEGGPSVGAEGRRIGSYRIVREIGRGGMARVFLAERADGQYEQQVALKLLRPGFDSDVDVVRFRAERQMLASLDHPHIARLLDGGVTDEGLPYIVLEHVDGEPIDRYCKSRNLTARERLDLFLDVCDAVEYAHRSSIVHRDLKPANIFVRADGTVKLLDFGVAKMLEQDFTGQAPSTGTQARWMTPQYAAPEQVRGEPASARTDVYQLGAVLYELLAGRTPFATRAHTPHELEKAVLESEPESLGGPLRGDLDTIVLKALCKVPEDRYGSAHDFAQDIRRYLAGKPVHARRQTLRYRMYRLAARHRVRLAAAAVIVPAAAAAFWVAWPRAADPDPSVVVLPFVNLSADAANDYFGDGLTEEIITRLSAIQGLKVISRTSAMHYKGSTKPLRQIASELKVAHVVEGSVRESNGSVRIAAQLIDARDDRHVWAENYEYRSNDSFRVQAAIAQAVARALAIRLNDLGARQLAKPNTDDPEAAELYRRARYLWSTRSKAGHEQALVFYQKAIERDSSYAAAYAGLADAYLTSYQLGMSTLSEQESYGRIKWAAERALALDHESADAHTALATVLWWQRNWPGTERELRRAIELNPGHASARGWYALLLAGMGRVQEAVEQSRRSYELDPFAIVIAINYAWALYQARDYDNAIEQFRQALEINKSWAPAYAQLGITYAQKGMHEAALREASRAVELEPGSWNRAALAYVHALAGRKKEAADLLQRVKTEAGIGTAKEDRLFRFSAFAVGCAHVALGEADSALVWLERTSWQWPHRGTRADPALDPLRSDPRFMQLVRRIDRAMGIPSH